MSKEKRVVAFDTECYRDYWLIAFKDVKNGKVVSFEQFEGHPLNVEGVRRVLRNVRLVSFNGNHYDMPMIALALTYADCAALKEASDAIITENLKPWEFEDKFAVRIDRDVDHIDLIEVAPGMASLKIYGGRLHAKKMQDLPIAPGDSISPEQREQLRLYCGNDLQTTIDLYEHLQPQLQLREAMTEEFGRDLRSKSDAQIAEAVIKDAVTRLIGKIERPTIPPGTRFTYKAPPMVSFVTEPLQQVLRTVHAAEFKLNANGRVEMPPELDDLAIRIGGSVYRMGIGGLHSSEQSVAHVADAETMLVDRDVASYYPALILLNKWAPRHLGEAFLVVYKDIVDRRLRAKRSGDKVAADTLKITINGSFGKLGSKWSALYSPDLLIQVTVTGQLCLLMLIEELELNRIPVVSANTDGIVIKCPRNAERQMDAIVAEWEMFTGLETEATEYRALYSRDVNNYIALKKDGGYKAKGAYASPGLQKNPTNLVCVEAVAAFLEHGTLPARTIHDCVDVRKFVTIRQVKGGGEWRFDDTVSYLGKAVRWYYATVGGAIHYASNGNLVARSEGCAPLMELPDELPIDLDHAFYVNEAYRLLDDIGFKHPKVED